MSGVTKKLMSAAGGKQPPEIFAVNQTVGSFPLILDIFENNDGSAVFGSSVTRTGFRTFGSRAIAIHPSGEFLVCHEEDSSSVPGLAVYSLVGSQISFLNRFVTAFPFQLDVRGLSFTPDGNFLLGHATQGTAGRAVVFSFSSSGVLAFVDDDKAATQEGMRQVAVSPDGRSFALTNSTSGINVRRLNANGTFSSSTNRNNEFATQSSNFVPSGFFLFSLTGDRLLVGRNALSSSGVLVYEYDSGANSLSLLSTTILGSGQEFSGPSSGGFMNDGRILFFHGPATLNSLTNCRASIFSFNNTTGSLTLDFAGLRFDNFSRLAAAGFKNSEVFVTSKLAGGGAPGTAISLTSIQPTFIFDSANVPAPDLRRVAAFSPAL